MLLSFVLLDVNGWLCNTVNSIRLKYQDIVIIYAVLTYAVLTYAVIMYADIII